ncbi:MAG TPA: MMPL family transporter, partial [Acidimicrobiales bacterium]|nr:MMPL family transporter [Acidimicrobiales bacterium]
MLATMARAVVRRRRVVLLATVVVMILAGAFGGSVVSRLSGGGFDVPGSSSQLAANALAGQFHAGQANFILVVESPGSVDSAAAARTGESLAAELARQHDVSGVTSYWSAGRPVTMRSTNGHDGLITAYIGGSDNTQTTRGGQLAKLFRGRRDGLTVAAAGSAVVYSAVTDAIQHDLTRAELIAFPITFVLLVLVFGGLVAALMPLVVGLVAIIGTLLVLRVLTGFTEVSVYALNLTTGLGLGLAVDYSLFVITRYREELARGGSVEDALAASVASAGRTVLFSSVTVALSLAALLVFPMYFLRSFAYAGMAVVLIAAIGAVVVLPAILGALGPRIESLTLFRRRPAAAEHGFWRRLAETVMRHPVLAGGAVAAVLLVLGTPFLSIRFGLPDDRVLPRSNPAQQASQLLRTSFPGNAADAVQAVDVTRPVATAALAAYATSISRLDHVVEVQSAAGVFAHGVQMAPGSGRAAAYFDDASGTWLNVASSADPYSDAGKALVEQVRAVPGPVRFLVGGSAAELLDTEHAIGAQLPYAGLIVALTMLLVLFLFTGSLLIPLKALVLNLLSLSASFGAMVFIFQEGHLLALVGHPIVTGTIDTSMPLLMFCVAFGLSMDYEVFLLSRIRETWLETGDNRLAVSVGLERTGRLITAAAALIAVVWLTFLTSSVTFLKLLGLGMALAVVVDATLVRGVLVPA